MTAESSAPPSSTTSRRRSTAPLSESETEKPKSKAIRKKASRATLSSIVREESEKEDEPLPSAKKVKKEADREEHRTPRRSAGEEGGFSDYNPFQSGGEDAAERERRRRRKVS
jgi:hypothetical protein